MEAGASHQQALNEETAAALADATIVPDTEKAVRADLVTLLHGTRPPIGRPPRQRDWPTTAALSTPPRSMPSRWARR